MRCKPWKCKTNKDGSDATKIKRDEHLSEIKMGKQLEFFEDIPTSSKPNKREEVRKQTQDYLKKERDKHGEEYCLNYLRKANYLWDMRAWRQYKNRNEVEEYVDNPTHKNDGHSQFCIERLKELAVDKNKIITAIMENNSIQYKNRLVPCFLEDTCPRLKTSGSYAEGGCNQCG